MKLIFTGTGSAFTVGDNNYQSNMLLEDDSSHYLLIDCGTDIRFALYEMGLSAKDIDDIFISHLHTDHVGGLECFALLRKFFEKNTIKPRLHINKDLVDDLWNKVLSGGLSTIEECPAELSSYFEVEKIVHDKFIWHGIEFDLIPAVHYFSNHAVAPCYGLFFMINRKSVYITSDTQFFPDKMNPFYQKADLIFHDCETSAQESGVHACYHDLCTLDPSIKAKMWLYHYSPGPLPDAIKDGFRGFVKKGQSIDFNLKETWAIPQAIR